ncbi:hypothetical protein AAFF_G00283960 [Aldrovandia affinis]|uniref:Uncharacterized protein n=1 Tax=Aldrovandia affinis TaxID=143900 RepID=A0AAD7TA36_9TELE|nr:hypothetical protein AAFF_G00283960 [Aldrovandia affinis]
MHLQKNIIALFSQRCESACGEGDVPLGGDERPAACSAHTELAIELTPPAALRHVFSCICPRKKEKKWEKTLPLVNARYSNRDGAWIKEEVAI